MKSSHAPSTGFYGQQATPEDCIYFVGTGTCRFGVSCRFNHPVFASSMQLMSHPRQGLEFPERIGQPDCEFFLKTGTCKFGGQCKYHHPQVKAGGSPTLNSVGLPLRPAEKECAFYLRTGCCKFGIACKFHHPERPSSIGVAPLAIHANGAVASPASQPSWPITRPFYFHGSCLPPEQSPYMPVYTSTAQSIPYGGWNSYYSDVLPSSNADQQGFYRATLDGCSSYMQRPEQPECQYYMQTGHCKFGANCKYYHPTSVAISLMSANLSPMGLPLRPGQPLCTFYLKNGICKFGPVCRFDHPIREPHVSSSLSLKELTNADEFIPPSLKRNDADALGEPQEPSQNVHEGHGN